MENNRPRSTINKETDRFGLNFNQDQFESIIINFYWKPTAINALLIVNGEVKWFKISKRNESPLDYSVSIWFHSSHDWQISSRNKENWRCSYVEMSKVDEDAEKLRVFSH